MNKERHIQLSWQILEHKWRYYEGPKYNVQPVPDAVYDVLEQEYKDLCRELEQPSTASDMVGFDFNRPSCKLVAEKMMEKYKVKV